MIVDGVMAASWQVVMPLAEADEVVDLGLAAVGPEQDVMQVHSAGLAAGETAAVPVAFAGSAPQRR